jgi:hypothetical protein
MLTRCTLSRFTTATTADVERREEHQTGAGADRVEKGEKGMKLTKMSVS